MPEFDYLLATGRTRELGRFRSPCNLSRGGHAVVRTPRGLEVGTVLRPASPRLAELVPSGGSVVRPMGDDDFVVAEMRDKLASGMVKRAAELGVTLLDAEVLLDGTRAVLYHAGQDSGRLREAVRLLSQEFEVTVSTDNLGRIEASSSCESGCGGCGSGGGCGTCGTVTAEDVRGYFAGLRDQMVHRRIPLV